MPVSMSLAVTGCAGWNAPVSTVVVRPDSRMSRLSNANPSSMPELSVPQPTRTRTAGWLPANDMSLRASTQPPLPLPEESRPVQPSGWPPGRLPQAASDYTQWYLSRLKTVEKALEGKEFICADRFTIADIAVTYALFLGTTLGLDKKYKPNCQRYLAAMMQRPAFIRAREKQEI